MDRDLNSIDAILDQSMINEFYSSNDILTYLEIIIGSIYEERLA